MKTASPTAALLSLAVAFAAWAFVVLFALKAQGLASDAAAMQSKAQAADTQQIAVLHVRDLARHIAPARAQIDTVLQTDPISLAALVGQAGRDAHVALVVSDVSPLSVSSVPGGATSTDTAHPATIGFTIDADGTFEGLVRAALLLETLPVPSAIDQMDLRSVPGKAGAGSSWHMNTHVRILTASHISS